MAPQQTSLFRKATQVEPLEQRIAPAILTANGVRAASAGVINLDADPNTSAPALLTTDLSGGNYLLYVEKGSCQVYISDLNANGEVDFDEITGISAGDGLRLVCFTDIHGDIVTNLKSDFTLTDSDNDASNGLDGRIILNSTIEKIELRSVRASELVNTSVRDRLAYSNYSIYGYIYAGKGFGANDGGLIIERNAIQEQTDKFTGFVNKERYQSIPPVIGGIKVGTAVSNQYFTFGNASGPEDRDENGVFGPGDEGRGLGFNGTNIGGRFLPFVPSEGQAGADINGFRVVGDLSAVEIGALVAGDGGNGGIGARGGDIKNFRIRGDLGGGYRLVAGNAGYGTLGQRGGNIENYMDLGSFAGEILLQAGRGGDSSLSVGGSGGTISLSNTGVFAANARLTVQPGDGGNGLIDGGAGGGIASLGLAVANSAASGVSFSNGLVTSMHLAPTVRTLISTGTTTVSLDPLSPVTTGGLYVGQRVQFTLDPDGAGPLPATTEQRFVTAVDYFGKNVTLNAVVSANPALGGSPGTPVNVRMTFEGDIGTAMRDLAGALANKTNLLRGFDFDGDGRNDAVYASSSEDRQNQLNVLFGDGVGSTFDNARTLYLNCGQASGSITVNDFNGDGRPDIAAASKELSADGIRVYFSEFDPVTGQFLGFSDPLFSPVIGFAEIQEDSPFAFNGDFNFDATNGARRILALSSGDFDGDGSVDLAVSTQESNRDSGDPTYFLAILRNGSNNGRFVADLDYGVSPVADYDFVLQYDAPAATKPLLKASSIALTPGAGAFRNIDVLYTAVVGSDRMAEVSLLRDGDTLPAFDVNGAFIGAQKAEGSLATELVLGGGRDANGALEPGTLGVVDTNRARSTATVDARSLEKASIQDFVIRDISGELPDGDAGNNPDIVFLVGSPAGYLVTFQGLDNNTFVLRSNPDGATCENSGIFISGTDHVGILPDMSALNVVTIIDYTAGSVESSKYTIPSDTLYATGAASTVLTGADRRVRDGFTSTDAELSFYDVYNGSLQQSAAVDNAVTTLVFMSHNTGDPGFDEIYGSRVRVGSTFLADLTNNAVFLLAGDGGNGVLGKGGNGGGIGTGILSPNRNNFRIGTGGVSVILPLNEAYEGVVVFQAGQGGVGGTNGGNGGAISGVSAVYDPAGGLITSSVFLRAGNGGRGISGTGGAGGSIGKFSVESGVLFTGGAGGTGVNGGNGGSVTGTESLSLATSRNSDFLAFGGAGGRGLVNGGAGGQVKDLVFTLFNVFDIDFAQSLQLYGGEGGVGLAGTGGAGGSVSGTSVASGSPELRCDMVLRAGNGGHGKTGGNGGDVISFQNNGAGASLNSVSVVAGNGGQGTRGNGGKGGRITAVVASSAGDGAINGFDPADPSSFFNSVRADLKNSHAVAGNGGDSIGGVGGAGGFLETFSMTTSRRSLVAAAGRGGDGLKGGGTGGDVRDSVLDSGSLEGSKLLIVAGEGGNAFGSRPTITDPLAFGVALGAKTDAVGGNGGNISKIKQATVSVAVDLIAGNGGDTPSSGASGSLTSTVGVGGSISDVEIAGDIGRVDSQGSFTQAAIRSYNNIYANQRMTDFVRTRVVEAGGKIDDSVGNVGIVVGARGRVRDVTGGVAPDGSPTNLPPDGLPDASSGGRNGTLVNVSASNIMSAVAGSVDRVESIRFISNLRFKTGGVFGDDKAVDSLGRTSSGNGVNYGQGNLDYLNYDDPNKDAVGGPDPREDRHFSTVIIGGKLVDGAIVGANQRNKLSNRDFIVA